jgi:hypothetical protein
LYFNFITLKANPNEERKHEECTQKYFNGGWDRKHTPIDLPEPNIAEECVGQELLTTGMSQELSQLSVGCDINGSLVIPVLYGLIEYIIGPKDILVIADIEDSVRKVGEYFGFMFQI